MNNHGDVWWYFDEDYIVVYTHDLKTKFNINEMGVYYNINGKMFARQFLVIEGSKDANILFSKLGLTNKNRLSEVRKPIKRSVAVNE